VYSHRHPDGAWLPGGASNTGGEALAAWGSNRLAELDEAAAARGPSSVTAWPLRRAGERFPFLCAKAEGFVDGEPEDEVDAYRAQLEGLAYLERLAYERLAELGASRTRPVLTAGGGARSHTWSRVRAGVLGDAVGVVAGAGSALGAAMLASSGGVHRDLSAATAAMAPSPLMIDPDRRERAALERGYGRFLEALSRRGWYRRGTTAPPDRGVVSVAPG
jgi:xylulokinase